MHKGKFFGAGKPIMVSDPFCDVTDPQKCPKWPKIGLNVGKTSLTYDFGLKMHIAKFFRGKEN